MTEDNDNALRERLRLKWLPYAEGFDPAHADEYERFLALTVEEQTELVRKMGAEEGEIHIVLSNARMLYGK